MEISCFFVLCPYQKRTFPIRQGWGCPAQHWAAPAAAPGEETPGTLHCLSPAIGGASLQGAAYRAVEMSRGRTVAKGNPSPAGLEMVPIVWAYQPVTPVPVNTPEQTISPFSRATLHRALRFPRRRYIFSPESITFSPGRTIPENST